MTKSYNSIGTVDNTGSCTIILQPINTFKWAIEHIAVSTTGTAPSTCQVFVDTRLFCGTAVGNGDTADGAPLIVNANQQLKFIWSSATPNSSCIVTILVDESIQ